MDDRCTCGVKFRTAEDHRDHMPCPGSKDEQIAKLIGIVGKLELALHEERARFASQVDAHRRTIAECVELRSNLAIAFCSIHDGVWFWQGDSADEPTSLTCPVIMSAETLRIMLGTRRADTVKPCTRPPPGWRCTRGEHADGPCAAVPVTSCYEVWTVGDCLDDPGPCVDDDGTPLVFGIFGDAIAAAARLERTRPGKFTVKTVQR